MHKQVQEGPRTTRTGHFAISITRRAVCLEKICQHGLALGLGITSRSYPSLFSTTCSQGNPSTINVYVSICWPASVHASLPIWANPSSHSRCWRLSASPG